MPFPTITDRIGGPHQRRYRPHAARRWDRRERALSRHQGRQFHPRQRVPILVQLRQAWGYVVLLAGIVLMFGVVFVAAPLS